MEALAIKNSRIPGRTFCRTFCPASTNNPRNTSRKKLSRAMERVSRESRQLSRHFGGIRVASERRTWNPDTIPIKVSGFGGEARADRGSRHKSRHHVAIPGADQRTEGQRCGISNRTIIRTFCPDRVDGPCDASRDRVSRATDRVSCQISCHFGRIRAAARYLHEARQNREDLVNFVKHILR